MIKQNKQIKNFKQIKHTHHYGGKSLFLADPRYPKLNGKYLVPYSIVRVNSNGTIKYRKGAVLDTVNIRQVHLYKNSQVKITEHGKACNMPDMHKNYHYFRI